MEINLSEHFTYKKLIKFTLPTIIMMIFTSIYGVVDGVFISNVAESNSFASINLVMPVIMIIGTIGFMIGTGGSAIIPLVYFSRKNSTMLKLGKTKFELFTIIKTCTNGSSEMVTNLSMSLVNILFNMQLMKYAGANGVSAYGIIMYVGFIFVGTYMGYSVGTAPIIGYHYGAEKHHHFLQH